MGRFLTTRRSQWLPGIALLGVAVGVAPLLGFSPGLPSWALYVGLIAVALLALGWLDRRRVQRVAAAPPPRPRTRLKLVRGAKYNLAEDDSTDSQKYVM